MQQMKKVKPNNKYVFKSDTEILNFQTPQRTWYCVSKRSTSNFLPPSSAELFCILVQTPAFASCCNQPIQLSEERLKEGPLCTSVLLQHQLGHTRNCPKQPPSSAKLVCHRNLSRTVTLDLKTLDTHQINRFYASV